MLPEISHEELAVVLDDVVAGVLEQTTVSVPPVDALHIAQRLGMAVAWDDRQPGRARLVSLAGAGGDEVPSILLRHDPRIERQHWAVAHEIGEAVALQVFAHLAIDPREAPRQAREVVANGIASRLLLPGAWFGEVGIQCGWDLLALKDIYSTASHELIARRMLDFPPPVIVAVYDQNRQTWRKSNAPGRMPPPSPMEIESLRRAHATGQTVYDDGPPPLRVWPIHEPSWQREIVRVEVDEFAAD